MLKRSKCFPCVSLLWALLVANPCWCEFSFSLVNLEGFPRKWAPTQQEPLRKDKIRGQNSRELFWIIFFSSWCLPVGWWDCFLRALKAHKETNTHDYQGWLQARPIREDIKKYFDLLHSQIMICSYLAFLLLCLPSSNLLRLNQDRSTQRVTDNLNNLVRQVLFLHLMSR